MLVTTNESFVRREGMSGLTTEQAATPPRCGPRSTKAVNNVDVEQANESAAPQVG